MPTELSVNSILQIVSEEKFGFKFGKPDRPSDTSLACILPILRETSQTRQYITFPETEEVLAIDSGTINKVNLENTSKHNVFLRSGTIFHGKSTQSRALTRSTVLYPGQKVALECRCIHQTHGIRSGSGFAYGGITPLEVDSQFYTAGYTPSSQHQMWDSVNTVNAAMMSFSRSEAPESSVTRRFTRSVGVTERIRQSRASAARPSWSLLGHSPTHTSAPIHTSAYGQAIPFADDLKKNFDAFASSFDDILSRARLHDNQVGLALITEKGVRTVELFDLGVSWEAIHKDSVKRMGTELLRGPDNTNVFEYKAENAVNAVRAVLALPFKSNLVYQHKPANGEPPLSVYGLTAQRFVGEVVELDGRAIHTVLLESVA